MFSNIKFLFTNIYGFLLILELIFPGLCYWLIVLIQEKFHGKTKNEQINVKCMVNGVHECSEGILRQYKVRQPL